MTPNEEKAYSIKTDTEQIQMSKQQKSILEQFVTVFHMPKKKSGHGKDILKAQIKLLAMKITMCEMNIHTGWD